jgi:hypothetical protein
VSAVNTLPLARPCPTQPRSYDVLPADSSTSPFHELGVAEIAEGVSAFLISHAAQFVVHVGFGWVGVHLPGPRCQQHKGPQPCEHVSLMNRTKLTVNSADCCEGSPWKDMPERRDKSSPCPPPEFFRIKYVFMCSPVLPCPQIGRTRVRQHVNPLARQHQVLREGWHLSHTYIGMAHFNLAPLHSLSHAFATLRHVLWL